MNTIRILFFLVMLFACGSSSVAVVSTEKSTPEPEPAFTLGINPLNYNDGPTEADLDLAKQLGAHSVRIWVHWKKIEPKAGEFQWEELDRIIAGCEERKIMPWALVVGSPPHASIHEEPVEEMDRLTPPRHEPYQVFLEKLVERYKRRVKYYEIWNEPDYTFYWTPNPNAKEYAELLALSYPIIKGGDPEAKVIAAATAGTALPYLTSVLKHLEGKKVFDAVAAHPYRWNDENGSVTIGPLEAHFVELPNGESAQVNLKDELLLYRKILLDSGYQDIPLWITEFGWPAHDHTTSPHYVSLSDQARFLSETYELVRTDADLYFVKGLFWFADRDWATEPNDPIAQTDFGFFGLLWKDGKWKPAANLFRDLASTESSGRR